jgi:hypothetical protein
MVVDRWSLVMGLAVTILVASPRVRKIAPLWDTGTFLQMKLLYLLTRRQREEVRTRPRAVDDLDAVLHQYLAERRSDWARVE